MNFNSSRNTCPTFYFRKPRGRGTPQKFWWVEPPGYRHPYPVLAYTCIFDLSDFMEVDSHIALTRIGKMFYTFGQISGKI
jgi:hypothetical protein